MTFPDLRESKLIFDHLPSHPLPGHGSVFRRTPCPKPGITFPDAKVSCQKQGKTNSVPVKSVNATHKRPMNTRKFEKCKAQTGIYSKNIMQNSEYCTNSS